MKRPPKWNQQIAKETRGSIPPSVPARPLDSSQHPTQSRGPSRYHRWLANKLTMLVCLRYVEVVKKIKVTKLENTCEFFQYKLTYLTILPLIDRMVILPKASCRSCIFMILNPVGLLSSILE